MDIKSVAKRHGLTMADVAERMGISRITLSQNLTGNPTLSTLRRTAEAIGCKVGDFFTDETSVPEAEGIVRIGDTFHVVRSLDGIRELLR